MTIGQRLHRLVRRRGQGDRGAAMVELAFVGPMLIVLTLGMVEIGVAWRDSVTITQSARQGARVASHLGDEALADRELLIAVRSVTDTPRIGEVNKVVVYAADADGAMADGCEIQSQPGQCNHYTQDDLELADDASLWGCDPGSPDSVWCPTERTDSDAYLGVYVEFIRPHRYGLLGGGEHIIHSHTVMRIEPEYDE